jgi:hypothetical protein
MKQWPSAFTINDEIYQIKDFSRTTTRVLDGQEVIGLILDRVAQVVGLRGHDAARCHCQPPPRAR